jgi:hypothetical protein
LIGIADALGNRTVYTRDATSNVTAEQVFNSSNVLTRTRTYNYDAVNRSGQSGEAVRDKRLKC